MKIHGIDVTGEAGQELMRMVHEAVSRDIEMAASVLRVECDECGGYGTNCGDIYEETCAPCQGEGTRTILSIWEARYGIRSTKGE